MMNCNEFKDNLTAMFDKQANAEMIKVMHEHIDRCAACEGEYNQAKQVLAGLKPSISFNFTGSGLKQNIINQIKKEENEMKTIQNKKSGFKKWHKQVMAVAASIVFVVAVFMLSDRSPFVSTAQAAENIMTKSINAMASLRSMFISMDVRSLKKENFDLIGTQYDFIEYKFWKQFSGNKPWRIEKPGRIVVFDGERQFLYIPELAYAITASEKAGFVEWMKIFLDPKTILEHEIAFSDKNDAKYSIEKTDDETILTVHANALGDFHNNYLKNSSVLESDNTRIYTFDKKTSLLKSFELFVNADGRSVKVIEIKNIAYNIPISGSTFTIELPQGLKWQEMENPGYNRAFTKITSKQAAKKFFTALEKEDFAAIKPVWSALQISDQDKVEEIKNMFGGLELFSLGEAFKSGLYPGEFVPYKIKLKSGEIEEHNLALRNDNPNKTWIVDGGL